MMETEVVVDADCESDLLCLVGVPLTDGMREDAGVSDEAKEYVHDVFALMTAGNGMMNVRNIPNVMEAIELGLSREEKRRVAMRFGHRKQIGIDDLMFVVDQKLLAESQRRVMSKVYECMAANTDVGISEGDLSRINADFERELTDDQITGMIQSTGRKRQGHVTFSEFMHALESTTKVMFAKTRTLVQ
ncbi:hypothetical protein NDN08_002965 [Rhodosorus marinus]|uniref:Calmodulin n=1 Tax=Rhodosorus marinus TaxID=101924 RepID=A0AAV8UZH3_9RHOD|nr:hypothetical protein NDN08_002965 [Rhodosorus marinus]